MGVGASQWAPYVGASCVAVPSHGRGSATRQRKTCEGCVWQNNPAIPSLRRHNIQALLFVRPSSSKLYQRHRQDACNQGTQVQVEDPATHAGSRSNLRRPGEPSPVAAIYIHKRCGRITSVRRTLLCALRQMVRIGIQLQEALQGQASQAAVSLLGQRVGTD